MALFCSKRVEDHAILPEENYDTEIQKFVNNFQPGIVMDYLIDFH